MQWAKVCNEARDFNENEGNNYLVLSIDEIGTIFGKIKRHNVGSRHNVGIAVGQHGAKSVTPGTILVDRLW